MPLRSQRCIYFSWERKHIVRFASFAMKWRCALFQNGVGSKSDEKKREICGHDSTHGALPWEFGAGWNKKHQKNCGSLYQRTIQGNGDSLGFGVQSKGLFTEFATNSTALVPAERVGNVEDVPSVYPDAACLQVRRCLEDGVHIVGVHTSCEAKVGVVSTLNGFIEGLVLQSTYNGTEDFLSHDRHVISGVRKHGWLDKKALVSVALTTADGNGPSFASLLDEVEHTMHLLLRHKGSLIHVNRLSSTNGALFRIGTHLIHEGVIH
mmetsp:Transcript_60643/g.70290  ORF Transcript_60643/g.70290 Transcript_60643/m.70290 type:complete len:265 (-) Transcript_60643:978-1772(-)